MTPEELIGKIKSLPPIPGVAVELVNLMGDPDVEMREVSDLINRDPGLTAELLKLCNSSYYGFKTEISSIRQASSMMGLNKLSQMAMTVLSSSYLTGSQPGYMLESGELWKHCIVTGMAAERIAMKCKYPKVGAAYTAGLLQDIGKIIISEALTEKVAEINRLAHEEGMDFTEAEKDLLGFTHAEAGAALLKQWNFPSALVESVLTHHKVEKATVDPKLSCISQLADCVAMTMGMGLGLDGLCYTVSGYTFTTLGLEEEGAFEMIVADVAERIQKSPEILSPPS